MIRLTDDEMDEVYIIPDRTMLWPFHLRSSVAEAQLKKALISVGKESKRMDGTIYLVPDYVEYRKALKEVGLE